MPSAPGASRAPHRKGSVHVSALNEVQTYDLGLRVETTHVEGADPSLMGCSCWITEPDGQWSLLGARLVEPFNHAEDTQRLRLALYAAIDTLLDG